MRIYIWHGYLLTGTGSNEYSQALARTLARAGHDVTVFCQDPAAASLDLAGARVVRPELPGPLPVFVLDNYPGQAARLLVEYSTAELDEYVDANVAAMQACGPAELLVTNHLLLGGPVGAASGLPYVVKAHGSELEFAMRGRPDLCQWATDTLRGARAVLAGSEHIESVVAELLELPAGMVRIIPPGVDTDFMAPQSRAKALAGLLAESAADPPNPAGVPQERLPDAHNTERLREFLAGPARPLVVYVGKLSAEKGVSRMVRAVTELGLPSIVVGFGPARAELEAMAGPNVLFTGPLQHRHLRHLWALATVSVVPSVFPEAFGMVAAEAASCGCPPLVARHSGLAEIAAGIAAHYPPELAGLGSFDTDEELAGRLAAYAALPPPTWEALSRGARAAVEELWSWRSVADRIVALA
ncbi:MAG: glycosyltransferase family 4 protein [Candidatus Nanopelagicales bacterium]